MKTLNVRKKLGINIALRDNARELFEFLVSNKIEVLDFCEVEFISRSFANELLKLESKNNIFFKKINMNSTIDTMFYHALEESPKSKNTSGFKIGNVDEILASL